MARLRVPHVRFRCSRCFGRLALTIIALLLLALTLTELAFMGNDKFHPRRPTIPIGRLPPSNETRAHVRKKQDSFKVEAFLDRSAPTVEAYANIVKNLLNCHRIRRIFDRLTGSESDTLQRVHTVPKRTVDFKWRKRKSCSGVPPHLRGRLRLNSDYEVLDQPSCAPRHRVAIIVPYRDREEHLKRLLSAIVPILRRQQLKYRIYVIEQLGNGTFNKGVLMNAGAREAMREQIVDCLVFHDVDMMPEDDRNLYSCPVAPRHMSAAVDKFNYTLPYSLLVGGVLAIRLEHFLLVNGYSNLYWGWGGEDDDMGYRIKFRKLEIIRPPEAIARYSMIKHEHRPESPNSIRSALLRMAKKRSSRDGLNTVKYKVIQRRKTSTHIHLLVDIGSHHQWHFVHGHKLLINF